MSWSRANRAAQAVHLSEHPAQARRWSASWWRCVLQNGSRQTAQAAESAEQNGFLQDLHAFSSGLGKYFRQRLQEPTQAEQASRPSCISTRCATHTACRHSTQVLVCVLQCSPSSPWGQTGQRARSDRWLSTWQV